MIAFDTNHLVRHIVQDNPAQCRTVAAMLEREAGHDNPVRIHDLVLMETAWVLESVYGFDRKALGHVLEELLEDSAFGFDDSDRLRLVLKRFRIGKADFSDYLIHSVAESEGLKLETFDKRLRKELG
ncbi:MAG: type II toxin-antitoxin system VapC family toxin [Opitutales bacterium]|nr:type II toxin-antitoxin system VapC family toxin [Opitutales bacterium]